MTYVHRRGFAEDLRRMEAKLSSTNLLRRMEAELAGTLTDDVEAPPSADEREVTHDA